MKIPVEEHDYRVVLSKANLRGSHLCNVLEEVEQGIPVLPFESIFPILRLRHAIHVVYGGSDL